MKKALSLVLTLAMLLSIAPAALAYPTQGVKTEVAPPEGREYFPQNVEELPSIEKVSFGEPIEIVEQTEIQEPVAEAAEVN